MTIQECYKQMGADYEDVLKRLYSESMIRKFARMFLNDDSYPKLERSLKEENIEEAFRAAHAQGCMPEPWLYQSLSAHL